MHAACFVLIVLLVLPCAGCRGPQPVLEVTYLGNEGYLVAIGDSKVLIDGLFRSDAYASPSDSTVEAIVAGRPPFDGIDCLLVTHDHPDHFDPGIVGSFLRGHPSVTLLASPAACGRLEGDDLAERRRQGIDIERGERRVVRAGKMTITAVCLPHGGSTTESCLAFVARMGGRAIVHMGDAMLAFSREDLLKLDWSGPRIDVLFLEHFDRSATALEMVHERIKPRRTVLMHVPPGREEAVRAEAAHQFSPPAAVFTKEGETLRFE